MSALGWLLLALAFGVLALVSYLLRLQRKSREIERRLDYRKMRRWRDED